MPSCLNKYDESNFITFITSIECFSLRCFLDVQLKISNVVVTENSFKLSWNKLKFAKMYHVYYAILTEMKIASTFKFIASDTDNAFIDNLSSSKTYQVFVKVTQLETDEEPLETIKSKTISIKTGK